jgi:hypothetical protein
MKKTAVNFTRKAFFSLILMASVLVTACSGSLTASILDGKDSSTGKIVSKILKDEASFSQFRDKDCKTLIKRSLKRKRKAYQENPTKEKLFDLQKEIAVVRERCQKFSNQVYDVYRDEIEGTCDNLLENALKKLDTYLITRKISDLEEYVDLRNLHRSHCEDDGAMTDALIDIYANGTFIDKGELEDFAGDGALDDEFKKNCESSKLSLRKLLRRQRFAKGAKKNKMNLEIEGLLRRIKKLCPKDDVAEFIGILSDEDINALEDITEDSQVAEENLKRVKEETDRVFRKCDDIEYDLGDAMFKFARSTGANKARFHQLMRDLINVYILACQDYLDTSDEIDELISENNKGNELVIGLPELFNPEEIADSGFENEVKPNCKDINDQLKKVSKELLGLSSKVGSESLAAENKRKAMESILKEQEDNLKKWKALHCSPTKTNDEEEDPVDSEESPFDLTRAEGGGRQATDISAVEMRPEAKESEETDSKKSDDIGSEYTKIIFGLDDACFDYLEEEKLFELFTNNTFRLQEKMLRRENQDIPLREREALSKEITELLRLLGEELTFIKVIISNTKPCPPEEDGFNEFSEEDLNEEETDTENRESIEEPDEGSDRGGGDIGRSGEVLDEVADVNLGEVTEVIDRHRAFLSYSPPEYEAYLLRNDSCINYLSDKESFARYLTLRDKQRDNLKELRKRISEYNENLKSGFTSNSRIYYLKEINSINVDLKFGQEDIEEALEKIRETIKNTKPCPPKPDASTNSGRDFELTSAAGEDGKSTDGDTSVIGETHASGSSGDSIPLSSLDCDILMGLKEQTHKSLRENGGLGADIRKLHEIEMAMFNKVNCPPEEQDPLIDDIRPGDGELFFLDCVSLLEKRKEFIGSEFTGKLKREIDKFESESIQHKLDVIKIVMSRLENCPPKIDTDDLGMNTNSTGDFQIAADDEGIDVNVLSFLRGNKLDNSNEFAFTFDLDDFSDEDDENIAEVVEGTGDIKVTFIDFEDEANEDGGIIDIEEISDKIEAKLSQGSEDDSRQGVDGDFSLLDDDEGGGKRSANADAQIEFEDSEDEIGKDDSSKDLNNSKDKSDFGLGEIVVVLDESKITINIGDLTYEQEYEEYSKCIEINDGEATCCPKKPDPSDFTPNELESLGDGEIVL